MKRKIVVLALLCGALISVGCSKQDQDRADRASEKAKAEAQKLKGQLQKGMNGGTGSVDDAGRKLDQAGQIAQQKAAEAGAKLNHAAILGGVKAHLASDVGLSAAAHVSVEVHGSVVTLSGTVSTAEQKRLAAESAAKADGVTQVVNHIEVTSGG